MDRYLSSVGALVLVALVTTAATPLESRLMAMRCLEPTRDQLAQLFLLRTNAPSATIQSTVTRACAAGLCYLGQTESYSKIRGQVLNADALEAGMCAPCANCGNQAQNSGTVNKPLSTAQDATFVVGGGDDTTGNADGQAKQVTAPGKTASVCSSCKGTGRCSVSSCNEGRRTITGFDGGTKDVLCGSCNGTAKCMNCKGTGTVQLTCPACKGKGTAFSKPAALKLYKDAVEQAIWLLK